MNVLTDQMIAMQTPAVATPLVLTHVNVGVDLQEMDSHAQIKMNVLMDQMIAM